MSRSRTPQQLRALAADLSERYPGCRANAQHDSGKKWDFTWSNGPSVPQVKKAVATAAPEAEVRLLRSYNMRAHALAGIRACLDGQVGYYADGASLSWQVEDALSEVENPDQTEDERLAAMADALMKETGGTRLEHQLLEPIAKQGVAHLLAPRQARPGAEGPLTMSPAEHLTNRYARGEDAHQWRMRLRTLPTPELVAAAQADEDLDKVGRLAVLGLLEEMRRLWERTEAAAFAAARDADAPGGQASWAQIGAVLGISRQGAHERGTARLAGTRYRISGPPDASTSTL